MRPDRIAYVFGLRAISRITAVLALAGQLHSVPAQQPVDPNQPSTSELSSAASHSDEAVHLIGFPETEEKVRGALSISPDALRFVFPGGRSSVSRQEITGVTVGEVSIETGGTAGKVTRAVIPFGGGSVLATVTHKQMGLLTIEFRDRRNALHGAVFLLPRNEAVQAQQQLGSQTSAPTPQPSHAACPAGLIVQAGTIRVDAIATHGDSVPAEYKVLLYEQLVHQLHEENVFTRIDRDGDNAPEAACPQYNLVLTLNAFKKGNAAVRASTGPVGFFVGTTSLKFHVQVRDANGTMLFDKDLKASKRGDTDSLNVADKIARSLTRDLKKASSRAARS